MNREWHLVIGGIAFLFYQTFIDTINSTMHYPWFLGIILLAIGSVLPINWNLPIPDIIGEFVIVMEHFLS
jgi:Na+-transporting NADH:ubiquinone oxidoreductase subunit NqrB